MEPTQILSHSQYKTNLTLFYKLLISGVYREHLKNVVSPSNPSERNDTPEDILTLPESNKINFDYEDTLEGLSRSSSASQSPSLTPVTGVSLSLDIYPYSPDSPTILRVLGKSGAKSEALSHPPSDSVDPGTPGTPKTNTYLSTPTPPSSPKSPSALTKRSFSAFR